MGNNNSGQVVVSQPPPPWTQSLPRDVHRHKKYGALQQGTKVLPERIPGQRLKPTENGHMLQTKGTLSARGVSEMSYPGSDCGPSLVHNHSASMTALNHPTNLQPSSYYPNTPGYVCSQHLRFGPPPSKCFTSEPDLRSSPTSYQSLPNEENPPHTIICESPTKGKIKSKKRYKAPLPPPNIKASISLPLERSDYVPSPCLSNGNWSSVSSPAERVSKSKPRKMGLFKKKKESRMSNYEVGYSSPEPNIRRYDNVQIEGRARQRERSSTPAPIPISVNQELKERAKSLDNLQHEINRTPPGLRNSLHSLEISGNDEVDNRWPEIPQANINYKSPETTKKSFLEQGTHLEKERKEKEMSSILELAHKGNRRMSTVERKLYEKQLEEMKSGDISSAVDSRRFEIRQNIADVKYRRSSSSSSSYRDMLVKDEPKDEWDLAEEEWRQRKQISDDLQREIQNVAKNLRKTSMSPETKTELLPNRSVNNEILVSQKQAVSQIEKDSENGEIPKTFFFGMGPEEDAKQNELCQNKSALSKLNDQGEVKIVGTTVEYSRHSLRPKEKRKSLERESWNKSLDYRDIKSRSRSREREIDEKPPKTDKKKLSREIDEFVATIEREKRRQKTSDELSNSISRKGDGGYHSRQNSGSFHLETEASDEDTAIRMNLRPTLPKRQLELPRFSPNAAWRLLGVEPSSKQKDVHSDIQITDEVFSIGEDQIHRYTRPTAPPRTSGEKSGDSGISGDAGSPGPMQEFESLTPEKIKISSRPLAVSSPVASSRLETKRTWTPAQDLDENSLDDNIDQAGKASLHQVSAMPKLTSRTNMFTKPVLLDSPAEEIYEVKPKKKYIENDYALSDSNVRRQNNDLNDDYLVNTRSLQRDKITSSAEKSYNNSVNKNFDDQNDVNWRENWSLSRSIPNSLNNCDDQECVSDSSKQCRSRSESRMPANNQVSENRINNIGPKPTTPGYMHSGNSGHIMYLPEYKSYNLNRKEVQERRLRNEFPHLRGKRSEHNYSEQLPSYDNERKSFSGDEDPVEPGKHNAQEILDTNREYMQKGNRFIVINGKKNKKFSYQSTVRMLEKKKLDEKLTKETEEKEKRRLKEVEAMMKVEQEFQRKREREKKRLKKQLQIYQQKQKSNEIVNHSSSNDESSRLSPYPDQHHSEHFETTSDIERSKQYSGMPVPFDGHRQLSVYQSLPLEFANDSSVYDNELHHQQNSGLFSGFKKWMKGRKEPRSGYLSDTSSATVTSVSRREPDGAPASFSNKKNLDNIRAEMIAASRHRKGNVITDGEGVPDRYRKGSPAPSIASKGSNFRTVTPDSKRAISPDSRRSVTSDSSKLTQELPEMRQEQRQYMEYRRSNKKALMPNIIRPIRPSQEAAAVSHNYRRDFCMGKASSSTPIKVYHDDSDRYSRNSNESRKSRKSNTKRNSSVEMIVDSDFASANSFRRQYSSSNSSKSPIPIPIPPHHDHRHSSSHMENRIPGHPFPNGYQSPHITPYNPSKGYRPVSFRPPSKILTVT